ncbi:MAG: hypothetical protein M3N13_07840 [Candidatus Eremiobacteraeota bacterium]|nr:hypothetical protein [Candidatus Eremiobacteraeota bacterium]
MIEAMVAIALTTGVMITATGAVTHSLHATALETTKIALRDDALSALADVRAATAYDPKLLHRMVGQTSSTTIAHRDAKVETVTVSVTRPLSRESSNTIGTAVATQDGATVTEQVTLYNEAPEPGSTVTE